MLSRQHRLSDSQSIKAAKTNSGYKSKTPLAYLVGRENGRESSRLAVVVSKKVGKACLRNRVRRRFVAAISTKLSKLNKNVDIVCYPNELVRKTPFADLQLDLKNLLEKCGLFS